jgi:hypothetical protein
MAEVTASLKTLVRADAVLTTHTRSLMDIETESVTMLGIARSSHC